MAALLVEHGRPGFYFRVLQEGEVGAGDPIIQVAEGSERMTVFDINELLYKHRHPRDQVERALRIPALSIGWRTSFQALLEQERSGCPMTGNPGLDPPVGPPAWQGFRPLRVSRKYQESSSVISLVLEPADDRPLATSLPGQFVVLRLQPAAGAAALMRSYSLSGEPDRSRYRVSIKHEARGAAGAYIEESVHVGDVLDVSAPRGSFTLRPGDRPVVLLSAGIGATPVLAMLHVLAARATSREVWWFYGARKRDEHPFAQETRALLSVLPHGHSYIRYSSPGPQDRPGVDFDSRGHLDTRLLRDLGVPRKADFYTCGPPGFMTELTAALVGWGVATGDIHTEVFGTGPSKTPGIAKIAHGRPHVPAGIQGTGALIGFTRSGLNVRWNPAFRSILELAEACEVPVRWSCRTGVCHTCKTGLIAGSVAYRPQPIDAPTGDNVLICCSHPRSDIILDL
jgi:ferredoxin-NADP reductase